MERRDPPPLTHGGRSNSLSKERLRTLKECPGEWFLVGAFKSQGSTTNLRDSLCSIDPEAMVEVTGRRNDDGFFDVYARYLGQR